MDVFVQLSFFIGLIAALAAAFNGVLWLGGALGMKASRAVGRVNAATEGSSDAAISSFGRKTVWRAGVALFFLTLHFGYPAVFGPGDAKPAGAKKTLKR